MSFIRLVLMPSFIGYCLFNLAFKVTGMAVNFSIKESIFGFIITFVVWITWNVIAEYHKEQSSKRENQERNLLFSKIKDMVEQALDKQADFVTIKIDRMIHPTAGVYYNVNMEGLSNGTK